MVTFIYKIRKLFYQNILWYHKNYVTLHQKSETLSHMNTKKDHQQQVTPSQEEVFREKTHNYLVCFIESCPLKEQCLRWLVGQYADTMPFAQKSINPRNPQIGGEQCVKFRPNTRVVKKQGMTHFYYDMPGRMEHNIRQELIWHFGRTQYCEMRNGKRLISPEDQEVIAAVCRSHGWDGPFVYDSEQEDWLW